MSQKTFGYTYIFILHTFSAIIFPVFTQNISSIENDGDGIQHIEATDLEDENNIQEVLKKFEEKRIPLKFQPKGFRALKLTPEQISKLKIWRGGIIPYYIDVVSYSDKVFRDIIRDSLQKTNNVAGINFVELPSPPENTDERWVFFVNRRGMLGCADHTVKNFTGKGVQPVILGYDCIVSKGELAEAIMSIVGVPAQHNAPDRDNYITVNMDSIRPDKRHLFDKVSADEWLFGSLEYDFASITHYDMHKYSADGRATIVPKDESDEINPSRTFSPTDILKIKMLYTDSKNKQHIRKSDCQKLFHPRDRFERHNPIDVKNKRYEAEKKSDSQQQTDDELSEDSTTTNIETKVNPSDKISTPHEDHDDILAGLKHSDET